MSKHIVTVVSELHIKDDEALTEYLDDREREWGFDEPEQIKQLRDIGVATLKDEDGSTTIVIREADE